VIKRKRRAEITIEKRRTIFMSRGAASVTRHCEECGLTVRMVSADLAAALSGLSARTIYRRVESGEVHYQETPDGLLLICAASIGAA
jgi:hypothetical protein